MLWEKYLKYIPSTTSIHRYSHTVEGKWRNIAEKGSMCEWELYQIDRTVTAQVNQTEDSVPLLAEWCVSKFISDKTLLLSTFHNTDHTLESIQQIMGIAIPLNFYTAVKFHGMWREIPFVGSLHMSLNFLIIAWGFLLRQWKGLHVQSACVVSESGGRKAGAEYWYISYHWVASSQLITVQSKMCTHVQVLLSHTTSHVPGCLMYAGKVRKENLFTCLEFVYLLRNFASG